MKKSVIPSYKLERTIGKIMRVVRIDLKGGLEEILSLGNRRVNTIKYN